jgi:hypothetical protein
MVPLLSGQKSEAQVRVWFILVMVTSMADGQEQAPLSIVAVWGTGQTTVGAEV